MTEASSFTIGRLQSLDRFYLLFSHRLFRINCPIQGEDGSASSACAGFQSNRIVSPRVDLAWAIYRLYIESSALSKSLEREMSNETDLSVAFQT